MWSEWGSCSVSCDVGMQRRDRSCSNPYPSPDGNHCFGESRDDRLCLPVACADGVWTERGSWSSCSESCGAGLKSRERTCTNPPPSLLGRFCSGSAIQTIQCNKHACSDGAWTEWGSWSSCSDSCGGGLKSRERTCTNPPPSLLGRFCSGTPIQSLPCNKQACSDHKIAFTAYGLSSGNDTNLIFPRISENYGNDYNSSSGQFVCSVPGLYYFSATLTKRYAVNLDLAECYLLINSADKVGSGRTHIIPYQVSTVVDIQ